jgi:hypothetical protein
MATEFGRTGFVPMQRTPHCSKLRSAPWGRPAAVGYTGEFFYANPKGVPWSPPAWAAGPSSRET